MKIEKKVVQNIWGGIAIARALWPKLLKTGTLH